MTVQIANQSARSGARALGILARNLSHCHCRVFEYHWFTFRSTGGPKGPREADMSRRIFIVVFASVGCATTLAQGVSTNLNFEASADSGATWGSSISVVPGTLVRIRLRVSLSNNVGAGSVPNGGGLAGFNFLPSLSNWDASDQVLPPDRENFAENGGSAPPYFIVPGPQPSGTYKGPGVIAPRVNGRMAPFGANGNNATGVPMSSVDQGNLQWRAPIIASAGVSVAQNPGGFSLVQGWDGHTWTDGTDNYVDPTQTEINDLGLSRVMFTAGSYYTGSHNIVVFQYSVIVGDSGQFPRTLTQGAQLLAGQNAANPIDLAMIWYQNAINTLNPIRMRAADCPIFAATINVVPGPGALSFVGLAALFATRRRRGR